jgi:CheY-like chemotaxis protein
VLRAQQHDPAPAGEPAPPPQLSVAELRGALHDVANALTGVLGWLAIAEAEPDLQASTRRAVDLARSSALHGRNIALRAMGASSDPLAHRTATSVEQFAGLAAAAIEPQARGRGAKVVLDVEDGAHDLALASPVCAMQVLTNLLLNAVGFTPEGGAVRLEVSHVGEQVRFVVRDEGPGFNDAQREHVFDGLASTRENGFGIGLRYAFRVTAREGGNLRLLDAGPGAAFELRWPSCAAATTATTRRLLLHGKRVLVLEDDQAVAMLLETALGARGASVAVARDETALASMLVQTGYDAAIVDLSPLQNPVEALAKLRAAAPSTRMVLITGSACAPEPGVLAQVAAWVRKPFEVGEVIAALLGADP